jgi:ferredoxin
MKDKSVDKLLNALNQHFILLGPQRSGNVLLIKKITNLADLDWSGQIPVNTFRGVFLPSSEKLFDIVGAKLMEPKIDYQSTACVGVNILDLQALTLFEQVFSRDPFYQKRRRHIFLVGYSANLPDDYKRYRVFSHNWEENILEHLIFDVFITTTKKGRVKFYSGSERGQLMLEKCRLEYEHIEFAGPISEAGPDKKMLELKGKLEQSLAKKIWKELDQKCIACGQCTIVCPTCFCYDVEDYSDPEAAARTRHWGNCFHHDFSQVAGGRRELDTVKKKIYFWYTHKFVRIPHEYSLPGCVSCGRCTRACPVGIDIIKVLRAL